MTRFTKSANGKYMIQGKSYELLIGSRAQVWHGTAYKTNGELKKGNLMKNKTGRIVSKSKHTSAKRDNRLVKAGYGTKKGKFGYVKLSGSRSSRSRKSRGGAGPNMNNTSSNSTGSSGSMLSAVQSKISSALSGNTSTGNTSTGNTTFNLPSSRNTSSSSTTSKPSMSSMSSKKGGSRRKRRKQRGGYSGHLPLSPHSYNSAKDGGHTSGVDLQFVAGSAG
jgi:hypothetical protein